MKNKMTVMFLALLLALGQVYALSISSDEIVLGEWNNRTVAARECAEETNIPLLLFRVNSSCSLCADLKEACGKSTFLDWQKSRQLIMIVSSSGDVAEDYEAGRDLTPESVIDSSKMPKIAVYWKKASGAVVHKGFVGRNGLMMGQSKGLPLEEQLMNAVDEILVDYDSQSVYYGGVFAVEESAGHRYEAGSRTTSVPVYLGRNEVIKDKAATNLIKVAYPDGTTAEIDLDWAAGEVEKVVSVTIPEEADVQAGRQITLTLTDANGVERDVNVIHCVEDENSVKNPLWIGEAFDFGEWTMDYEAALKKGAYTLVAVTGGLWCPDCKRTDENFLSVTNDISGSNRFQAWAKEKKVNLVTIDVPNFKSATHVAESPCLLSRTAYTASLGLQSGLAYLSRRGVSDADALEVLKRNHALVAKSSATSVLRRPEDANQFRTGVPIFVLLGPDGKVASRLTYLASKSPTDSSQWDNIIKRFDEMLVIASEYPEEINNNHHSTTTNAVDASGGHAIGEISHADFIDVFKLDGLAGGVMQKVTISGTRSAEIKVEIVADQDAPPAAVATGDLLDGVNVAAELPAGNYFVRISGADIAADEFSVSNPAAGNFHAYELSTSLVHVPQEKAATATVKAGSSTVVMRLAKDTVYHLVGLSTASLPDCLTVVSADENLYRATGESGDYALTLENVGGAFTYQIWNPGKVGFTIAEQKFFENTGSGYFKVARTGGASGKVTVRVDLIKDLSTANRLQLKTPARSFELVWEDGDSEVEKTVEFEVAVDSIFQSTDTFVVELGDGVVELTTGKTLPIEMTSKTHTVTVLDTDAPILDQATYDGIRLFPNFEVNQAYPVNNILEDGRVTIKKVSGRLPSGLRMKYDADTKSIVLSGKVRSTGTSEYSFTISEKRGRKTVTGWETKFVFDIVDPNELPEDDPDFNVVVGNAISLDFPVYAKVEGRNVLAGVLDLSVSSKNRISAKFSGVGSRTVSFSGYWQTLVQGTAVAVLTTRKGEMLDLRLSGEGRLFANLQNVTTDFGGDLTTAQDGISVLTDGDFEPYSGYYTVTLPVLTNGLALAGESMPLGTGYLTLKMSGSSFTRTGRVSYSGRYAEGSSVSGTAYLVPNAYADGSARLCIFKYAKKNSIGLVLKVKPEAGDVYETEPMAVLADEEVLPYWNSSDSGFIPLKVYGAYYDTSMNLQETCLEDYQTDTFAFLCDMTYFSPSEKYGSLIGFPDAAVTVSEKAFEVEQLNDFKLTMKLSKKTGVVSGKVPIRFESGNKVTAKFYGILLPHWHDCGCGDGAPPNLIENRPFFSGFAYYTDTVDGKRVKRSFAVDLGAIVEVAGE